MLIESDNEDTDEPNFVDIGSNIGQKVGRVRNTAKNRFNQYLIRIGRNETFDEMIEDDMTTEFVLGKFSNYLFKFEKTKFEELEVPRIWYNTHRQYLSGIAGAVYEKFPKLKTEWTDYVGKLFKKVHERFFEESDRTGKSLEEHSVGATSSDHEFTCAKLFEWRAEYAPYRTINIIDVSALGRVSEV